MTKSADFRVYYFREGPLMKDGPPYREVGIYLTFAPRGLCPKDHETTAGKIGEKSVEWCSWSKNEKGGMCFSAETLVKNFIPHEQESVEPILHIFLQGASTSQIESLERAVSTLRIQH